MVMKNDGRMKSENTKIKCKHCKKRLDVRMLIEEGLLVRTKIGKRIQCPYCSEEFYEK